MARFVILVIDEADAARVEVTSTGPLPAPDVPMSRAENLAVHMLHAAMMEATGVVRNDGLLELLKEYDERQRPAT